MQYEFEIAKVQKICTFFLYAYIYANKMKMQSLKKAEARIWKTVCTWLTDLSYIVLLPYPSFNQQSHLIMC